MTSTRTRRKPGENRVRLLEAGTHEFGIHGYSGASTSQIARRAGVPQPHLYVNFRTKQDLFLACVSKTAEAVLESGGNVSEDGHLRLLYQAVGASRSVGLQPELSQHLMHLRGGVSEEMWQQLLTRAAASFLESPAAYAE